MPLRPSPDNASIRARAAAWIVCPKEERKIPTQNLKNYQQMKEEKQKDDKEKDTIGMVHLFHKQACKCE